MICTQCSKNWNPDPTILGESCPFCGYNVFTSSKKQAPPTSQEKKEEQQRLKSLYTQSKLQYEIEQEDPSALCTLGYYYSNGTNGYPKDLEKAFEYFLLSAKGNHGMGQCNLGVSYAQGYGTEINLGRAFYWYGQSAKNGEPRGICEQANCYMYGKGVMADHDKGYELLLLAAEKGYHRAYYYLAFHTYQGCGTQADAEKGYEFMKKSLTCGDRDVAHLFGMVNLQGDGCPVNYKLAVKWLETAARKEYPDSIHELALCYWAGFGVKKDLNKAKEYLEQALTLGHQASQHSLEDLTLELEGNLEELEAAVKKKRPYAYYLLGTQFMRSPNKREPKRVRELLDIATNYHITEAYYPLGCCYREGIGGRVSKQKARQNFLKGYHEKEPNATCAYAICLEEDPDSPEDLETALTLYKQGAGLEHSESQYRLALCFLNGVAVAPSRKLAMVWFRRAKELGNQSATQWLDGYQEEKHHLS